MRSQQKNQVQKVLRRRKKAGYEYERLMSGSEVSWTEVLSGVDKHSHGRRFKVQMRRGIWIVTDKRGG